MDGTSVKLRPKCSFQLLVAAVGATVSRIVLSQWVAGRLAAATFRE